MANEEERERERGYIGRGERELGTKRNQDVKEEARSERETQEGLAPSPHVGPIS